MQQENARALIHTLIQKLAASTPRHDAFQARPTRARAREQKALRHVNDDADDDDGGGDGGLPRPLAFGRIKKENNGATIGCVALKARPLPLAGAAPAAAAAAAGGGGGGDACPLAHSLACSLASAPARPPFRQRRRAAAAAGARALAHRQRKGGQSGSNENMAAKSGRGLADKRAATTTTTTRTFDSREMPPLSTNRARATVLAPSAKAKEARVRARLCASVSTKKLRLARIERATRCVASKTANCR